MVSKGLDFDHVGLVGVLQADDLLHYLTSELMSVAFNY